MPSRPAIRLPRSVAFAGMSAALLAFFIAAGAPTPIFPLYEREWAFAPSLLTLAFGVYAIALIIALLVFGSLSDHLGRRPLLIAALSVELVSMVVFLFAPSIEWLIVGRILQGLATGVASATFGAAVVELAPERRKKVGAMMTSLATTAGLGIGALFAGVIALAIPDAAAVTVWIVLIALIALGTVLAFLTPETATRRPGALEALKPRVAVPPQARRLFAVTVPTIIAVFLANAFFLGLLPTLLAVVFGVTDPLISGAINFVVFTAATLASALSGAVRPHRLRILGGTAVALGAILLLAGLATADLPLVWAAAVAGGVGSGFGLTGSTRGLVPQVEPHQRAALFAAFFSVAYITLSVAIIGGGLLAGVVGVQVMAAGYMVLLAVIALVGVGLGVGVTTKWRNDATSVVTVS